jgi:hypothetical protein
MDKQLGAGDKFIFVKFPQAASLQTVGNLHHYGDP